MENCRGAPALSTGHTHREQCCSPGAKMILDSKDGRPLQLVKYDCMQRKCPE